MHQTHTWCQRISYPKTQIKDWTFCFVLLIWYSFSHISLLRKLLYTKSFYAYGWTRMHSMVKPCLSGTRGIRTGGGGERGQPLPQSLCILFPFLYPIVPRAIGDWRVLIPFDDPTWHQTFETKGPKNMAGCSTAMQTTRNVPRLFQGGYSGWWNTLVLLLLAKKHSRHPSNFIFGDGHSGSHVWNISTMCTGINIFFAVLFFKFRFRMIGGNILSFSL